MQKRIIIPAVIILAISGMFMGGNVKGVNTSDNKNKFSVFENAASATVSSETPSAGTCCPARGWKCTVGAFTVNDAYLASPGSPCQ